jgi:hypothetical protein
MGRLIEFVRTRPKTSFLILLVAVVALYVLAFSLIETDRKKITDVIWESKGALENKNVDGVMKWVAPDFRQEDMDREGLRSFIRDGLDSFGAPEITILKRAITVNGGQATSMLNVLAGFPELVDVPRSKAITKWRVSLRKSDGLWYITEVMPLEVEGQEIEGLRGLRGRY